MPSASDNKGLFMLLPDGPVWRSSDVKSMQGFMEEFNLRADESDMPQLMCAFEKLVDTLGIETCTQALDRVKEQRLQQQLQRLPGYQSNISNTTASSISAYSSRTMADDTRHEENHRAHAGKSMEAAETLQTLMKHHVGGKGFLLPGAADVREEIQGGKDGGGGGGSGVGSGGGGTDAFHSVTASSVGSPSHSLSLSPPGNSNNINNTDVMDLLPLQSQATLFCQSQDSSPGAFTNTTSTTALISSSSSDCKSSNMSAHVIPPASLSWSPNAVPLPPGQAPTNRMPIPNILGQTRPTAGEKSTETISNLPYIKPEVSSPASASRKRARSSASSSTTLPAPATATATAPAAPPLTTSTATGVEDGYIPTPRNDGPWHYLGTLPASSTSFSSAADGGGGDGSRDGGKSTSGEAAAAAGASTSSVRASSAGSDEEGTKARPAAMNFGRYGDHLPYSGRKVCRVKGCDGHQRWPDYLCGQHGGGRCRWEGCSLFHQGINSMGLLLCGKHCKAVGAAYRRPRSGGNPKADGGGGGGGARDGTVSSSTTCKQK